MACVQRKFDDIEAVAMGLPAGPFTALTTSNPRSSFSSTFLMLSILEM